VLARLAEIGVDYAQGYAIERPFALSALAGNVLARDAATQDAGEADAAPASSPPTAAGARAA